MDKNFISIVIPVYNEENNLTPLYEKTKRCLDSSLLDWEIIFVNDGSKDSSLKVLVDISQLDPRIKVVNFRRNFGQTAAMMAGIDFASGEVIVPMDADMQNDPSDIPRLLEKINEGFDVCSGWRKDRKDHSLKRNLPSKVANWLISKLSGVKLSDYGCSLKAYRRDVIKGVRLYGEMHRFIPIYASWNGAKVTQIPVNHNPRLYGTSNYGMERVVKVFLDLLLVIFLDKYAQKPIYVFGGLGLLSIALSFVLFIISLYLKYFSGISFVKTPLPIFVAFTGMIGVMCILLGFLAEILMRTWHESQGKKTYLVRDTINFD